MSSYLGKRQKEILEELRRDNAENRKRNLEPNEIFSWIMVEMSRGELDAARRLESKGLIVLEQDLMPDGRLVWLAELVEEGTRNTQD